jgi:hypothetical protein
MTHRLAICVFATLLVLAATAGNCAAQGRGRGGFVGAPARMGPAPATVRSGGAVARPPAVASRPAFNGHITAPVPRIVARPPHRVVVAPPYYGFYSGFYGGFYDPYPYVWAPPSYSVSPYVYAEPSYVAPSPSLSETELAYQVERLTREVERLREDQANSALRQTPPPQRAPDPPPTPITLVFRDGRRMSIQNYAVVRQTLWVIDERMSTRIDLSDLDLEATQQTNTGRVLLLPVPAH